MPEIHSDDGRYMLAVQGDGNVVVYDRGRPVWDKWGYESGRRDWPSIGEDEPTPPEPPPVHPPPDVRPPSGSSGFQLERPVRVSDQRDGVFVNRMYSYWPASVVLGDAAYVFAGHTDEYVYFFQVLSTGHVVRLGSLVPYRGTGESWYWDAEGWVYLLEGPRLRRVNPFSGENRVVFDISDEHPGCMLWQSHSSDSGQTHSATVKRIVDDGAYPAIGTVVFRNGRQEYFPAQGSLDESALAGDEWLIIKEDDDNRVINLRTRETRIIRDRERALGHSDCGPDYMVGEADKPDPGACVIWNLRELNRGPRIMFHTTNMGYISIRAGKCLWSGPTHLALVSLDGFNITPLLEHGGGSDYDSRVKANLSPCGRVAAYVVDGQVCLLPIQR